MYYKELLRARGALTVYTIVTFIVLLISLVSMLFVPHSGPVATPAWPGILAVSSLFASVLATCLGSTLSQENDGHLEFACTKPVSRLTYATTAIAIDMAAILAAELVGFVFIAAHYGIGHHIVHYVAGPNAAANAARFILFPLAWYALIAAFGTGLRGKAGIVQGLIWPIAIALAVLRVVPLSPVWHDLFVAVNWLNPLVMVTYHEGDMTIVGPGSVNVVASALMLALLVIAGWAATTMQWRRIEA